MGHQLLGRRHFPKEPPADGVEPPNDESGVIHRSNALGLHEGPPSGRVAPASSLPPAWLLVSQIGGGERLSSPIRPTRGRVAHPAWRSSTVLVKTITPTNPIAPAVQNGSAGVSCQSRPPTKAAGAMARLRIR